jgi:predicted component of type VI protein secretion system
MMNKTYSAVFLAWMGLGLVGCNGSDEAKLYDPQVLVELTVVAVKPA